MACITAMTIPSKTHTTVNTNPTVKHHKNSRFKKSEVLKITTKINVSRVNIDGSPNAIK
ncbi:hypothetical protein [Mannheimia bovis]|uniref:Uncharacterized protein n=1 Tax=Mannheimia bovis TaxID=2770636 RepID=A0A7H1C0P6_9PAST|nr:hypothetical protein [Mannheimia bovis]QNS14551.1 hypothetical protein ICJ55_07220 [Mannheimia bovis]